MTSTHTPLQDVLVLELDQVERQYVIERIRALTLQIDSLFFELRELVGQLGNERAGDGAVEGEASIDELSQNCEMQKSVSRSDSVEPADRMALVVRKALGSSS